VTPVVTVARRLGLRRDRLRGARVRAERGVIAGLHRRRPPASGRILCYHSVGTPSWGYNDVPAARFRSHLELALAAGYRFVPADRIAHGEGQPGELAITFDDALRSVGTFAAPILAELRIPWTVFVVSDWAAGRNHGFGDVFLTWDELRKLASDEVTVSSHSVSHPNFGRIDEEQVRRELIESGSEISAQIGRPARSFAIPFGQSRNWAPRWTDLALEAGYDVVYAQTVAARLPGTVPRTFVTGYDGPAIFRAALQGAFDQWEE
jgi:peptidoglycan/xylan/chitin deacetylase (PgdA/CDA1 family)